MQAVMDVRIANKSEENKFKLQTLDGHKPEDCPTFGNFAMGIPRFDEVKTILHDMPPKVLIIGRTEE
jgi:hypothetical protein